MTAANTRKPQRFWTRARARRRSCVAPLVAVGLMPIAAATAAVDPGAAPLVSYHVVGDGIPDPLAQGDAARGKSLIAARDPANCVLCHAIPGIGIPFAGNVGPSLEGIATRLSPAQLRLRVVDEMRINPQTVMPSYYRVTGLELVARAYQGKPILTASQVEDVVAYLATLQ